MTLSFKRRCSGGWPPRVVLFSMAALLTAVGCGGSKGTGDASSGQTGGQEAGQGATGGGGGSGGGGNGGGGNGGGNRGGLTGTGGDGTAGNGSDEDAGSSGSGGGGGSAVCPVGSGVDLGVANHLDEGNNHVTVCSVTNYQTVPPSSGTHYPIWPVYKTYTQPVPWGYLMHGLEHGAVVLVYNCPAGCPAEVAAAQAWINGLPAEDPLCPGEKPRVILAPDPTLDVRWAASAWGWTLRWCTFDAALLQPFFAAHYNQTFEKICRSSGGADQSATGWCP